MNEQPEGVLPPAERAKISGLDLLRGMMAGIYPLAPIGVAMNFWIIRADHGSVDFAGEPTQAYLNPIGVIHGGWHATLLDTVMGCAVHSTVEAGFGYTTVEMKVHYVRAILPGGGEIRAEGRLLSRGRQIATSEGKLFDARGKLLAHGTETCMIFPAKGA